MTSIATLTTRVRQDLHDEDSANYRWTDAHLQRHLERAIRDYSYASPQEKKTTIATVASSRDISISGLTDLIEVLAVEWPTGKYPAEYNQFSIWVTTLSLLIDGTGDGTNSSVYWLALHDVTTPTHPTRDDELVARGAAGYAAIELESYSANRVNTTGEEAIRAYRKWGEEALRDFRSELSRLKRVLRPRVLYTAAIPRISQTRDFGPGR